MASVEQSIYFITNGFYHLGYRPRLLIPVSAHIIADVYSASRLALPHTLKQKTPSLSISGSWKLDAVITYIWSFQDLIPLISRALSFVNEDHEGIVALWHCVVEYDLASEFICYLVLISYYMSIISVIYLVVNLVVFIQHINFLLCCYYTRSIRQ